MDFCLRDEDVTQLSKLFMEYYFDVCGQRIKFVLAGKRKCTTFSPKRNSRGVCGGHRLPLLLSCFGRCQSFWAARLTLIMKSPPRPGGVLTPVLRLSITVRSWGHERLRDTKKQRTGRTSVLELPDVSATVV
ncbi:hypothetical protein AWC38_SpisGene2902 [Stylophora pistillata]|uniref:Uncharacterized protein n=1 Tax=Stylophora pistillata TaxID=50429 RepID=A0A2B4SUX0_STYPI|nr:hypothetical protein AWC38_SpisGene2902 [Stylophora pistillata]